ncbi:MAG: hypothetical protein Q7T11_08995 [Deltaproteobacteria bacterium]|nr:hypothetical protein [Deltaproteobacteria bacterium]
MGISHATHDQLAGIRARIGAGTPSGSKLGITGFHHIEFLVPHGMAGTLALRHGIGMGMRHTGRSDNTTDNFVYSSQLVESESGGVRFLFTAPYSLQQNRSSTLPLPFDPISARKWVAERSAGVRRLAVNVDNATAAYRLATEAGALGTLSPQRFTDANGSLMASAIALYTNTPHLPASHAGFDRSGMSVDLMFIEGSRNYSGFFPGYAPASSSSSRTSGFGILDIDHVVVNTWSMMPYLGMLERVLGFEPFAMFDQTEVGTPLSSLNSVVMATGTDVLLPVNEGIDLAGQSQINEFMRANGGYPGIQHIALRTEDLIGTINSVLATGLFTFLGTPSTYYELLEARLGREVISRLKAGQGGAVDFDALVAELHKLGIFVDSEDRENVLFQAFTYPILDDSTFFIELIERCCKDDVFRRGCAGFGKGNFKGLYAAIERAQNARGGGLQAAGRGNGGGASGGQLEIASDMLLEGAPQACATASAEFDGFGAAHRAAPWAVRQFQRGGRGSLTPRVTAWAR